MQGLTAGDSSECHTRKVILPVDGTSSDFAPDFYIAVDTVMAVLILSNAILLQFAETYVRLFLIPIRLIVNLMEGPRFESRQWKALRGFVETVLGIYGAVIALALVIGIALLPVINTILATDALYRKSDSNAREIQGLFVTTLIFFAVVVVVVLAAEFVRRSRDLVAEIKGDDYNPKHLEPEHAEPE